MCSDEVISLEIKAYHHSPSVRHLAFPASRTLKISSQVKSKENVTKHPVFTIRTEISLKRQKQNTQYNIYLLLSLKMYCYAFPV